LLIVLTRRAYSHPRTDGRFYFAAAVPAVGFVHGPADLYPLNAAMLESYTEDDFIFMKHGRRIDTLAS
jgi:hypothetical protein